MNSKSNYLFWGITTLLLIAGFSLTFGEVGIAVFWVSIFLPVTIAVSYVFNKILIPKYLLSGRTTKFWLYSAYTILISMYAQMLIAVLTFLTLANFQIESMSPVMTNLFVLGAVMYLIVFVQTSMLFFESLHKQKELVERYLVLKSKMSMQR